MIEFIAFCHPSLVVPAIWGGICRLMPIPRKTVSLFKMLAIVVASVVVSYYTTPVFLLSFNLEVLEVGKLVAVVFAVMALGLIDGVIILSQKPTEFIKTILAKL